MSDTTSPTPPRKTPYIRLGWLDNPAFKLAAIAALLLAMLIPVEFVASIISEREERQGDVQREIASSWGPAQTVGGPVLVVPWQAMVKPAAPAPVPMPPWMVLQQPPAAPPEPIRVSGSIQIVPASLAATVTMRPEQRRRGLFGAVVYEAEVALDGKLAIPADLSVPAYPGAELLWRDAYVVVAGTDLRSAPASTALTWDGTAHPVTEDVPMGDRCGNLGVMGWRLRLTGAPEPGKPVAFATSFPLRGTQAFDLAPSAREVTLAVDAPWATPSFGGDTLPVLSTVTDQAFHAEWRGGVGVRQAAWVATGDMCAGAIAAADAKASGVTLLEAVPVYRMVNRASKYALLFLALSFLTYYLFERAARIRIDLMQYGLLGLSVALFGLLLLALAEPFGFEAAYAGATALVLGQASLYTAAVTRRARLTALFAAVLAGLFGFLYVVLRQESYALLSGAVAVFAILSVVMAVTSWIGASREAVA